MTKCSFILLHYFTFSVFLPSKQCVDRFTKEQREKFERVWYVMINDLVMPYLIVHPFSGDIVSDSSYFV